MNTNNFNLPKKVHVIGICGVATSALAIAFHEIGVEVTGSDKGFFPPVSTELEKHNISFYAGWHVEKMIENGIPDVIIIGTASGSQNPETIYAKEKNIPMYSFAEAIGKYFAKEKSIVCVGTWGKTSSSALLSFILNEAKLDPTYMFGGVSLSHEASAKLTDSKWNVFEGDEYKSSPTDTRAKFFYYKPTHLLLTAVSWDHADLYPTEENYFDAFRKLLPTISENGFIVACADHEGVSNILNSFDGKIILYGRKKQQGSAIDIQKYKNSIKYVYSDVSQTKDGLDLTITIEDRSIITKTKPYQSYKIHSPMIGLFQAENITGCFAMAHTLGISHTDITNAIGQFRGLKRRLEKRHEGSITVFDDIAHSPEKASAVLQTLRAIYSGKIITIFEPNSGGRSRESVAKYDNAFKNSDVIIIPRLTKLKIADDSSEQPMEGEELSCAIAKTHSNVHYIDDDNKLVEYLISNTKNDDIIAFLGSHGFRGMIEETVNKIK